MLTREPHPESLMRLSLVRHMLTDPTVRLVPRRVDTRWRDERQVTLSMTGFNPFLGTVFYPQESAMQRWLADPFGPTRPHNGDDRLLYDLLFAVHDYLHVWATRMIQHLAPQVGFGTAALSPANLEDQVFCQLLSEAVATVGLDYWFLCTFDLNDRVPIGTRKNGGLTVAYHDKHLAEYRRFNPALDVQRPAFLTELCRFYCSGEFLGFDANDLRESPLLLSWLSHEISYGEKQREYSRLWFRDLGGFGGAVPDAEALTAAVDADVPWRLRLMEQLGEALWRKVKEDQLQPAAAPVQGPWRRPAGGSPDFRFCNVNALGDDAAPLMPMAVEHFDYYFSQLVSSYDRAAFDPERLKLLPTVKERRDPALLRHVLSGQRQLDRIGEEPAELLFLN